MTGKLFAEGLRRMADWYEEHPDFPQPSSCSEGGIFTVFAHSKEMVLDLKERLGAGVVEADDYSISAFRSFGDVQLRVYASRSNVCVKRVVRTEKKMERVPTRWEEKEVEKEIVEWDCPPELVTKEGEK